MSKLVAVMRIEDNRINESEYSKIHCGSLCRAYIFNNMWDCIKYFEKDADVELVKEPNAYDDFNIGCFNVKLVKNVFSFDCYYAKTTNDQ